MIPASRVVPEDISFHASEKNMEQTHWTKHPSWHNCIIEYIIFPSDQKESK